MASLSLSNGLFLFLHLLLVPNLTITSSAGLRFRSQYQGCLGFQALHLHPDRSISMASRHTTPSSIAPRTPTQRQEYLLIGSGAINSAVITHASCTIKVAFFPHMRLDTEAITGLPCLEEALDCFRESGLLPFVTDNEHWNEELLLQFYATLHIRGYNRIRRLGSLSG